MSKLIAGGDSFVYGSELKDCVDESNQEQASKLTFTALIAKELDMEYICTAMPGYSNSAIRRTVIDACETHNDIGMVLVQWSFTSRYEFKFGYEYANWKQVSAWLTEEDPIKHLKNRFFNSNDIILERHSKYLEYERLLGVTEFAKIFYKYLHPTQEKYTTLSEMLMLQQYLELKQIPYLFTIADSDLCSLFSSTDNYDASLINLKNLVNQKYLMYFPNNLGFWQWAINNKFPIGTTHPLEEAHLEAAHIVYEHLRYIGRLP